jgi:alpha-L-rhamnosidase
MKKFIIKPNLVGDLTHANTKSDSLYGTIVSKWSRSRTTGTFDFEVPTNTTARVFIPAVDGGDVKEGGQPAANAQGVTYRGKDGNFVVFEVTSGNYRFTSPSLPAAVHRQ